MYAVIFRSTIKHLDEDYQRLAKRMRELAFNHYNCIDFTAVFEGQQEIAISYWHCLDDIKAWRQNPEHIQAIERGQADWYSSYHVEVVEIKRTYQSC